MNAFGVVDISYVSVLTAGGSVRHVSRDIRSCKTGTHYLLALPGECTATWADDAIKARVAVPLCVSGVMRTFSQCGGDVR